MSSSSQTSSTAKTSAQALLASVEQAGLRTDRPDFRSGDTVRVHARIVEGAKERAAAKGADVRVLALAALRATREAEATVGGEKLPCIIGTPLAGEHVGDVTFDGMTETALL